MTEYCLICRKEIKYKKELFYCKNKECKKYLIRFNEDEIKQQKINHLQNFKFEKEAEDLIDYLKIQKGLDKTGIIILLSKTKEKITEIIE